MPMFVDADEVYRFLGKMFEIALADDELAASAATSGVVARFRLVEPDCQLVIDLPGRRVITGSAGAEIEAAVELEMKADDAHALWLGLVQPSVLLATRRVRVRGSVRKLLRMNSLGERLTVVYEKLLTDAGRQDLLKPTTLADV